MKPAELNYLFFPMLRSDPTLFCVSAWNDNGKRGIIDETKPELLYRTDFFGGLGWMMTKELWTNVKKTTFKNKLS
jgi:alpha-1,3-mannosyl-glycoprotein beta-1,2-N-acetylglucosaminyltransferase